MLNFNSSWECTYSKTRKVLSFGLRHSLYAVSLSERQHWKVRDSASKKSNLNYTLHNVRERYFVLQLAFQTSPQDLQWYFHVIISLVPVKSFARSGWFIRQWLANFTHSRRIGTWISLNLFWNKTEHYNKNSDNNNNKTIKKKNSHSLLTYFYTISNTPRKDFHTSYAHLHAQNSSNFLEFIWSSLRKVLCPCIDSCSKEEGKYPPWYTWKNSQADNSYLLKDVLYFKYHFSNLPAT